MRELVCAAALGEKGWEEDAQWEAATAVLDDCVGKETDKQKRQMRKDLHHLTVMAFRWSVRKVVPSVPPAVLSVSSEEDYHRHS